MNKDISDIYFKNLLTLLNKTHHLKLFYLPGIHSVDSQTRDYDNNRLKYFFDLKKKHFEKEAQYIYMKVKL